MQSTTAGRLRERSPQPGRQRCGQRWSRRSSRAAGEWTGRGDTPSVAVRVVEHQFEHRLLFVGRATPERTDIRPRRCPRIELCESSLLRFEHLPCRQLSANGSKVATEDPDVEILVRPGLAPEKEVERPAAGDPPRPADTGEQRRARFGVDRAPPSEIGRSARPFQSTRKGRARSGRLFIGQPGTTIDQ